jgi:hypothetical protein
MAALGHFRPLIGPLAIASSLSESSTTLRGEKLPMDEATQSFKQLSVPSQS